MGSCCDAEPGTTESNARGQQSRPQAKMNLKNSYDHFGLPNIGNTCYLNAILQLLYSAKDFRDQLIATSQQNPQKMAFHHLLAAIFKDIHNSANIQTKKAHLLQIVTFIQKRQQLFSLYQQNDAVESLLFILNLLNQEDPSHSNLDYFKVVCEQRCECIPKTRKMVMDQYLFSDKNFCLTCKQEIESVIHSHGKYLIYLPKEQPMTKLDLNLKFISQGNKKIEFSSEYFLIYSGGKTSGHYYCYTKTENRWILINDSEVKMVEQDMRLTQPSKIMLLTSKKKSKKS